MAPNRQEVQFSESIQMQLCTFEAAVKFALIFLPDTIEKVQSTVLIRTVHEARLRGMLTLLLQSLRRSASNDTSYVVCS